MTFTLVYPPFDTGLLTNLERVSDAWLADKGGTEKGYSLGAFEPLYLEWSPLALVHRDGELIAFANVLPPYGPGGHASVDLMRHVSDAPRSTMDFLFAKVMQWAKDEGHEVFSLGMRRCHASANPYARANEALPRSHSAMESSTTIKACGATRRVQAGMGRAYWPVRAACGPGLLIEISALVAGGYRKLIVG